MVIRRGIIGASFYRITGGGASVGEIPTGPVNQPPVAATSGPSVAIEGVTVELTGSAYDPDGTIVSEAWTDADGNELATGDTLSITAGAPGDYAYTYTVYDDDGALDRAGALLRVRAAASPDGSPAERFYAWLDAHNVIDVLDARDGLANGSPADGQALTGSWTNKGSAPSDWAINGTVTYRTNVPAYSGAAFVFSPGSSMFSNSGQLDGPVTTIAIGQFGPETANAWLVGQKDLASGRNEILRQSGKLLGYAGGFLATYDDADSDPHVYGMMIRGAESRLYVDGEVEATNAASNGINGTRVNHNAASAGAGAATVALVARIAGITDATDLETGLQLAADWMSDSTTVTPAPQLLANPTLSVLRADSIQIAFATDQVADAKGVAKAPDDTETESAPSEDSRTHIVTMTSLEPDTTYLVRAEGGNAAGTFESDEVPLTTLSVGATTAPEGFTVYRITNYRNQPTFGTAIPIVYQQTLYADGSGLRNDGNGHGLRGFEYPPDDLPGAASFLNNTRAQAPAGTRLAHFDVFDHEGVPIWPWAATLEDYELSLDYHLAIVDGIQAVTGRPVSTYGMGLPFSIVRQKQGLNAGAIPFIQLAAQKFAGRVPVIHPNAYAPYAGNDAASNQAEANTFAETLEFVCSEWKKVSTIPIVPFMWDRYHNNGGNNPLGFQYQSEAFYRTQLEAARDHADGVALWGGFEWWADGVDGKKPAGWRGQKDFDASATWWDVLRDVFPDMPTS